MVAENCSPPISPGTEEPYVICCAPHSEARLHLSIDERLHNGVPIDRETDLPVLRHGGKVSTDQYAMRREVKTAGQHLAEFTAAHPERQVIAQVGNGNLLANPWFTAWEEGVLYHLRDEPVFRQAYTAIVPWKADGRMSVEDVFFARENGRDRVLVPVGNTIRDVTEEIRFVTTAQPLVRHGQPVPLEQIAEEWYDTRHLVRPLVLKLKDEFLYMSNAQLQRGLVRKALCGPVEILPQAQVDEDTVIPLTLAGSP
jgi:hypothetical protein